MGVLSKAIMQYFRDPHSRPLFIEGHFGHSIHQGSIHQGDVSRQADRNSLLNIYRQSRKPHPAFGRFENTFTATVLERDDKGFIAVGPPVMPENEPPRAVRRRLTMAEYFWSKLRDAPGLNTEQKSKRKLLLGRWRILFIHLIIGSIGTLRECVNLEVLQDIESRKRFELLFEEAFQVLNRNLLLGREECVNWLKRYISLKSDEFHRMTIQCFHGRDTEVEDLNGWLVDRGRLLGIPCPEHEKILNEIHLKTQQQREKVIKLIEEIRQKKMKDKEKARWNDKSIGDGKYRLTKLKKK